MKCSLDGHNAKVLARAVQTLSKFGADLFVEADDEGLLLRAINATRSAVGSYKFKKVFFDSYTITPEINSFCKVTAKACFNVFQNLQQVQRFEIQICAEEPYLEINKTYQHDQTRKVNIAIIDEENLTAAVNIEDTPNTIIASCKIFNEISSNFTTLEEEITLETSPGVLAAKNYVEGARVNDQFMRSQLQYAANELEKFDVKEPTSITFCLKEFRAFLAFAEILNENISLHFSTAGSPLFLRTKKLDILESVLILSTLCPEDIEYLDDTNQNSTINNNIANMNVTNKRKLQNTDSNTINEPRTKRKTISMTESVSSNETVLFDFDGLKNSSRTAASQHSRARSQESLSSNDVPQPIDFNHEGDKELEVESESESISVEFYDTEEQNEMDVIERSPRANIVRTIFSRCFQNTYFPEEPTSSSEVFAPDSDLDD